MEEYYGNQHIYRPPSYMYRPESSEYPGYDSSWVLGRDRDVSYYLDEHYHHPNYASYPYYARSRSAHFPDTYYDRSHAHLAWATEVPVKLKANLCCEECKIKMDRVLRDIPGVHDVGISGWKHALVTVTGTASPHKILKVARKATKTAELWDDYEHGSHYSYGRY